MTTFTCEHQMARISVIPAVRADTWLPTHRTGHCESNGSPRPIPPRAPGREEVWLGTMTLHYQVILPSVTCCNASLPSPTRMFETTGDQLCFHPLRFSNYKRSYALVTVWPSRNIPSGHFYPILIQRFIITYTWGPLGSSLYSFSHVTRHEPPLSQQNSIINGQSVASQIFPLQKNNEVNIILYVSLHTVAFFFFNFLAMLCGMQDLINSSLTRDGTCAPCIGSKKS